MNVPSSIGWKDSNPPLRIKLKLWRRNYLVIASDFFQKLFFRTRIHEILPRIIVCAEPILEIEKISIQKIMPVKHF